MAIVGAAPKQVSIKEITSATSALDLAHARELLLEYGRFVLAQPGAGRFCFGSLEREASGLPSSYLDAGGGSLMAYADTEPVGFVAWRALESSVALNACEMKRLWVRPHARGLALGRTLTLAVIERARSAGYQTIYLDTAPASMAAAHRLYLDLGFEPCPRYNDNLVEGIVFLRKAL